MWEEAADGIEQHLLVYSKNARLAIIAELPQGVGGSILPKMDHLVCFLPGALALGATEGLTEREAKGLPTWTPRKAAQMRLARELTTTCWGMYAVTATGLAPEIAFFNVDNPPLTHPWTSSSGNVKHWKTDYIIKPLDAHNLQRPETVESLFVMWRITGDVKYREWGWEIFKSFQEHARLPNGHGYTSLNDVTVTSGPRRDNMESFWLVSLSTIANYLADPTIG